MDVSNKMCLSKQSYESKKEALRVLSYLKETSTDRLDNLRVYKCPLCSRFHLGNSYRK